MKATYIDMSLKKGEPYRLVQRIKNNKRPQNAVYGGNGSYIVSGTKTELLLYVKAEDGHVYYFDIYDRVLDETCRKKLTDKLYEDVKAKLSKASFNIENSDIYWNITL